MRFSLPIVVAIALALAPAAALAQWQDNFDGYPVGPLVPQGGWTGWGGNPAATAYVVSDLFRSAPNSAEIRPTSDCVQQFTGVNSGQWIMSGWSYIPTGIAGDQYFILLNTYPTTNNNNWSCQVQFNMTTGVCLDADNPNGPTLPLVRGQWVEVRVEINFATDQQTIYYNGALLNQKSWTAGTLPGGALNLAALDLFSNSAPSIFWDDLVLRQAGATPVEPTSWGAIKANFR
jgi:hypothetical protein